MDEFLVAIISGVTLLCYTFFMYIIFDFKYKIYVRWTLAGILVLWLLISFWKRKINRSKLTKMGIDAESYMYYQKYTSWWNKVTFVLSYLIQDYVYEVKSRNKAYNFSKGMFRFDDSLGEYYIDWRLGWYDYLRMNILKNRLSLHKLRIFSLEKCNQMLLGALPEQKEFYKQVKEACQEKVNTLSKKNSVGMGTFSQVENFNKLYYMIRKNLCKMEQSRKFMKDNMDAYHLALKKKDKRKDDVREIKNLYIDLDKKDQNRM